MNKSEEIRFISMNIIVNYIVTCLFIIIAIIGILGNILVIVSVHVDSRMKRSLTNRLIVHVGCCDLIILLFNIPDIIQFVLSINGNWILSEISCKLIRTILVSAEYASVLTMCAVTIERFIGIVYPLRLKFLREKKHVTQITIFVWIFSLMCASPNLFYLRVRTISPTRRSCQLVYHQNNSLENQHSYIIHKSIESTIFYFLPLLLQIYCYVRIATQLFHIDDRLKTSFILKKNQNTNGTQDGIDDEDYSIDNDENMGSKTTISESFVHSSIFNITNNSRRTNFFKKFLPLYKNSPKQKTKDSYRSHISYKALKSRRSVIKMLSIVVLIYFISFSPQVLVFILFETNLIQPIPKFIETPYFIAFTMLLVTISSASNPIVYAIFCSKFRQSFAKIFQYLWICDRSIFNDHSNKRSKTLEEIHKQTYYSNGKIIDSEKRKNNNKKIFVQNKDLNG